MACCVCMDIMPSVNLCIFPFSFDVGAFFQRIVNTIQMSRSHSPQDLEEECWNCHDFWLHLWLYWRRCARAAPADYEQGTLRRDCRPMYLWAGSEARFSKPGGPPLSRGTIGAQLCPSLRVRAPSYTFMALSRVQAIRCNWRMGSMYFYNCRHSSPTV